MPGEPAATVLADADRLIWARHRRFALQERARAWWAETLSAVPAVGIPWATPLALLRVSTHPRAPPRPLGIEEAWDVAHGWLRRAEVFCPGPAERHRALLGDPPVRGRAGGDHTPGAHPAALAIEWGLELRGADRDLARYPGLPRRPRC